MEQLFQADLNGVFEYIEQNEGIDLESEAVVELIQQSLSETLQLGENDINTEYALHTVLFRAWRRRKESKTSFAVSRYHRGLGAAEFIQLMDHYALFNHTITALYQLAPETATESMQELMIADSQSEERFYPIYLRICMCIASEDLFDKAFRFLKNRLHFKDKNILAEMLSVLQDIFAESAKDSIIYRRQTQLATAAKTILAAIKSEDCIFSEGSKNLISLINQVDRKHRSLQVYHESTSSLSCTMQGEIKNHNQASCKKRKSFKLVTSVPLKTEKLLNSWINRARNEEMTKKDLHKYAFLLICERMRSYCLPSQPLALREHLYPSLSKSLFSDSIYDKLVSSLGKECGSNGPNESAVIYCKIWCLQSLQEQKSGWKSVLKLMMQYADLWVIEMTRHDTLITFCKLICQEKLQEELYHTILKLVTVHQTHGEDMIQVEEIKSLCLLLFSSLEYIDDMRDLSAFRNYTFIYILNHGINKPSFSSLAYWPIDFRVELVKVLNQIVSEESQDIKHVQKEQQRATIQKLIVLSVIWPYQVVYELVISCFKSAKQHLAIIPVLRELWDLCLLKKANSGTILMNVLKDILQCTNYKSIHENTANISSFITSCCELEGFGEYPIILLPEKSIEYNTKTILNPADFLTECVLPWLNALILRPNEEEHESNMVLFRLSLHVLNSFCQVKSVRSKNWLTLVKNLYEGKPCSIGLPIVLKASPFQFARCLSKIMDLRNINQQLPQGSRLQDLELVRLYCHRLSCVLGNALHTLKAWSENGNEQVLKTKHSYHSEMEIFFEQLGSYDWKTQLLWCDLRQVAWPFLGINQPFHIQVPEPLYSLTGSLSEFLLPIQLTGCALPEDEKMAGWLNLFEGCKISRSLTKALFKHQENWMYNLLLLWKHPNEDEVVTDCLHRVLHPSLSLSVHEEYVCLLLDFLGGLFQSFNGAQVVRDYSYPIQEMCQFTARLTDTGCKYFFTVLYVMKLFSRHRQSLNKESANGDEQGQEAYYVSGLIKVLQSLYPWSSPRRSGSAPKQPVSLKRIREALLRGNVMQENMVRTARQEPVSSGATEDQSQAPMTDNDICSKITDVHYPFLDKEAVSNRSLSVLTLCMLCYASYQFKDTESREMIRVLLLQIVEGLRDNEGRQEFYRAVGLQTKSTINHWRKYKQSKKRILLRPVLDAEEERLIRSYVMLLQDPEESRAIMQALEVLHTPKAEIGRVNKKEAIYVI